MRLRSRAIISIVSILLVILSGCLYIPSELPGINLLPTVQTFEASPAVIKAGEYSTLSWAVTGASRVSIDNNIGNVAIKGNIPVSPGVPTYYTLTASNSSGSITARTQIMVSGSAPVQQNTPPNIVAFTAVPASISSGTPVALAWTVINAASVYIDQGIGNVSLIGGATVSPISSTIYTLTALNPYGSVSSKAQVVVINQTVGNLPVVNYFTSTPSMIVPGDYANLRWSVTGSSSVQISGVGGGFGSEGNCMVSPLFPTVYTLTATNDYGATTATVEVATQGYGIPTGNGKPVIISFFSNKNYINPGEAVTLYWNTSETTLVSLDPGGQVSGQGSKTVYPYVTSDYILTASNSNSMVQNKLTITVNTPGSYQTGTEKVAVLSTIPGETGSLVKNNAVYTVQDTACVGDTPLNLASRAFLSFDISGIPLNATIDEATLDLSNYSQIGNPTYPGTSMVSGMGALEVYFYPYGGLSNLDIMAYNRPGTTIRNGNVTSYPLSPWLLDVKTSDNGEQIMQNLVLIGQPRCQFRIQFFTSTNWDMKADMFCFDDAKLIIKYTTP